MTLLALPSIVVDGLIVGITCSPNPQLYKAVRGTGERCMTSKERHEARYQRRKAKREKRRAEVEAQCGDYSDTFTFSHLYRSYKNCIKGVGWKSSTQRFKANALMNVNALYESLEQGRFKSRGFYEFDTIEGGKQRHIKSVHISERVVQRCLCDYSLIPAISRSFVYDNGACMKNKGIDFALNRLTCHLQRHWRKWGTDGYVLIFDFSKFFANINCEKLKEMVNRQPLDIKTKRLTCSLIDDFGGEGLGLGSQISQVCALSYPSAIDHFIKSKMRIKGYGRYMDDGYVIHRDKEVLQQCLEGIRRICDELGIIINEKKTMIIKLSRGMTFLKKRFFITNTGRVIRKISRETVTRMRRKLKTFKRWYEEGRMTLDDIRTSYASWKGHVVRCNSWRTLQSMDKVFEDLFGRKEVNFA